MRNRTSELLVLISSLPVINQVMRASEYLTNTYTQAYLKDRWLAEVLTAGRVILDIYQRVRSKA